MLAVPSESAIVTFCTLVNVPPVGEMTGVPGAGRMGSVQSCGAERLVGWKAGVPGCRAKMAETLLLGSVKISIRAVMVSVGRLGAVPCASAKNVVQGLPPVELTQL